ncbi:MAG: glycosyltransferase, partial [Pseudomonadota bacterium]
MFNALHHFENVEVQFFDYVTEAQQRGVAGMSDRLVEIVRKEQPDLLLYSPLDLHVDILHESLKSITDHTDTQTIIWMNDDHLRFDDYARLWAPCADHIITTSQEAVSKYHQAGFGPKIIKSQWAFNPFTYRPTSLPRTRDVSFVGSAQGNRLELIGKMRQSGLPVDVFGYGWTEDTYIPFYDMVRIFSQSRINLNLSNSSTITTQQIRRRNFEVPGCRGLLLTTPVDNLEEYYESDKEVVVASSMEELIDKSRYYLTHEREREEIAQRGYERTLAEHTWTHRLVDIFKHIGFTAVALPLPQITLSPFIQLTASSSRGDLSPADAATLLTNQEDSENIYASVIVGAYNQLQYTRQCVESILHYTEGSYELLLMDNGSTDGTFEYFESVRAFHPHTRVIRCFHNRIVEANGNYVFSLARGKYCVGVSNDTIVHDGWLKNFMTQIESAPDIGMVGPRSNNVSGPQAMQVEYDTLETYQTFAAEWSKEHQGENFLLDRIVGVAVIMKKSIFNRMGGWDPDLPTNGRDGGYGFSDDDFSLRFRLAGYKSLVANDVFIHHFGSVTASKYRPDLFGPAQNINKEKYLQKLRRNGRVSVGQHGELTLKPYGPDDHIPIAENAVIRSPRICIVESDASTSETTGRLNRYAALADSFQGQVVTLNSNSTQTWLIETISKGEYDFIVLADKRLAPSPEKLRALIDTVLCYPDVVVMVPVGNYAPSTHARRTENGKSIEIIQYADLSLCVINIKLIRPFSQSLAPSKNDEDLFWFLQRRIRGEGYFIAKTNEIIVDSEVACINHPYDTHPLPEQWVQEKKYTEAIAVYTDDLSKDPTFVESLYQLACIAKEKHQTAEAIKHAERALQIDPHHIQSLTFLSRVFLEQGDLRRAESV